MNNNTNYFEAFQPSDTIFDRPLEQLCRKMLFGPKEKRDLEQYVMVIGRDTWNHPDSSDLLG